MSPRSRSPGCLSPRRRSPGCLSPRRRIPGCLSPRRYSPGRTVTDAPSSLSNLIAMLDYEPYTNGILEAVPEREWRLLAAMLRRREEDEDRAALADHYHRMWELEKQERKMEEAEASEHHKRYLHRKRQQERTSYEYRQLERVAEDHIHRRYLMESIRHKEMKSAEVLATEYDKKASEIVEKAIEDEARQLLAAGRRSRWSAAQEWCKRAQMGDTMRRVDDARHRRCAMLRDTSQRVAIETALSLWESTLIRRELAALEHAKRAQHAWHAAVTRARGQHVQRARDQRLQRAKEVAELCARLRDAVRKAGKDRSV